MRLEIDETSLSDLGQIEVCGWLEPLIALREMVGSVGIVGDSK